MRRHEPCSSYRPGSLCADGFPLTGSSACSGHVCWDCGKPNDIVPACMRDDIHPRWLTDSGLPKFYRPTPNQQGEDHG